MARVLSTAFVLALLAATAVAFAVAEGAKLTRSPIAGTSVTKVFSPDCARPCTLGNAVATISFRLRSQERLDIWIQRGSRRVRTLVSGRAYPNGSRVTVVWDGFTPGGTIVADGNYRPYVKLERSHRTVALPNTIVVDTKPPAITVPHPLYPVISPDGDGHKDVFVVPYKVSEPAHAILLVGSKRVETTYREPLRGTLRWDGKLGTPPEPARAGRYVLFVAALDLAGNLSKPFPFAVVQVRYVVLARQRVVVRLGGHFALRVSTDAPVVHWKLHGRSGVEPRGTLRFRAPKVPGTYSLYVFAAGHAARCVVVVR